MSLTTPTLPVIYPTVPGKVEGIISVDPLRVQCQECGLLGDAESVGLRTSAVENTALVIILSGIHFHWPDWPDGTNPRLCRPCRLARGCTCSWCADDRRRPKEDR